MASTSEKTSRAEGSKESAEDFGRWKKAFSDAERFAEISSSLSLSSSSLEFSSENLSFSSPSSSAEE